tara:strand:- start:1829 stop:4384 length:2556 start_codon:yes stop_codon:yes gene_type:complete
MGFTGQIFATRIAIGLAVPSPQALAKTGGTLARGIQNIQSQVMQARRAQAGTLGQYQAELNKLNSTTMSTTQKLNNEINVSLKRSLTKMDQTTNQALGKSFNNTKKGYNKLQAVLSKPLANQLMTGMGGLKGIDAMIQKTQNLNNMGRANRQEIIRTQEQIVTASTKAVDVASKEVQQLDAAGKLESKKGQVATDNLAKLIREEQINKEILADLKFMNREIDTKRSKMRQATEQAKQFSQSFLAGADALRNKFNAALRTTAVLVTAVGYKLQQNVSELVEYERELLNANSVFNLTNSNLFDVSQSILEFGNNFGISTQNASAGLYQLASAGVTAEEAMQILPSTLKLSMAVQGDHNTISKLTAQTLFGFGMEMSQAAELTDKFAFAIQKSLIEYQDLSSAVKFALPFFTSTGQSIDQLLGALQVLTNRALEAGIAGRGLRQALAEFAESALDAEVGFRKMGVEILNAEGEMLQLNEIAAQFAQAVGPETASNTELLTTLIEDLNVRGATAFIHLVQASDEFTQAVEDTRNAGGQLDEMVKIQNASLQAQIQILKTNVFSIFAFRDAAYEGTEFINGFHEAIHNLVQGFKNQIIVTEDGEQKLTDFGMNLQEMATGALNSFAGMFETFVDSLMKIAEHGDTFIAIFEAMAGALKIVAGFIGYMAETDVPLLNKSLLEVYATLKLISMLGIFTLGSSIFKGGKAIYGGLAGVAAAGRMAATGTGGGLVFNKALGRYQNKATGKMVSKAVARKAMTRLGLAALGPAGAVIGTALLAKDIYDYTQRANGGYVNPMAGGGMASGRSPYLVGEQGPELFVPEAAGQILNKGQTDSIMDGRVVFKDAVIGVDSFGGLS